MKNQNVEVIVVTEVAEDLFAGFIENQQRTLDIFRKQPGFVEATSYKSLETNRMYTKLIWQSIEDHYACQKSSDWDELTSQKEFQSMIEKGQVKMTVDVVTVIGQRSSVAKGDS